MGDRATQLASLVENVAELVFGGDELAPTLRGLDGLGTGHYGNVVRGVPSFFGDGRHLGLVLVMLCGHICHRSEVGFLCSFYHHFQIFSIMFVIISKSGDQRLSVYYA